MQGIIQKKQFSEIDLNDKFFDTLKSDYPEFEDWFVRKRNEEAYVLYNENSLLNAFLYLKTEDGPVTDISPPIEATTVLKIGTLKVNAHGTNLGERFIKKALDEAIFRKVEGAYVTIFAKHEGLVSLLKKYGFVEKSIKGNEIVLWKTLKESTGNYLVDYPRVSQRGKRKYVLSIYPEYHTRLFPDSILMNERFDAVEDVSHTNSIHKLFISRAPVSNLQQGDIIVMYRTSDEKGPAKFRSVATSICVVEKVRAKKEFKDQEDFLNHCYKRSVYTREELQKLYMENKRLYAIQMTYNIALRKRLTRNRLMEEVGLDGTERWTFLPISDKQFDSILMAGDSHESLVID